MKISGSTLVICLGAALLCGCASSKPEIEVEQPLKVTVSSGGRAVPNTNEELVHRIDVGSKNIGAVASFLKNGASAQAFPMQRDQGGALIGFLVKDPAKGTGLRQLGFESGDVVTAVNRKAFPSVEDLRLLLQSLLKTRDASATVLRGGHYHKLLYKYISN